MLVDVFVFLGALDTCNNYYFYHLLQNGTLIYCILFGLTYAAQFGCVVFAGFMVVYALHMVKRGRHLSLMKEKVVHTILWIINVCILVVFISTCTTACSDIMCPRQRLALLTIYATISIIFLLLYIKVSREFKTLERRETDISDEYLSKPELVRRKRLLDLAKETSRDIVHTLRWYPLTFVLDAVVGSFSAIVFYCLDLPLGNENTLQALLHISELLQPGRAFLVCIIYYCDVDHRECVKRLLKRHKGIFHILGNYAAIEADEGAIDSWDKESDGLNTRASDTEGRWREVKADLLGGCGWVGRYKDVYVYICTYAFDEQLIACNCK